MDIKLNIEKKDTQILKGIGILMIMLHNLMHKLPNMPLENEFKYHSSGGELFFSSLFFKSPVSFSCSFLGHYGVQIFIFLSAYAFYLKKDEIMNMSYFSFIKKRYIRIFYPLIFSMIAVSFLELLYKFIFFNYPFETLLHTFIGVYVGGLLQLTSLHPFLPEGLPGGLGPWWFISFILQAYFIFPVLFRIKFNKVYQFVISFVLSYMLIYLINSYFPEIRINYTVIGHLPEILSGIYFAKHLRNKSINVYRLLFVMFCGFLLLLLSNINKSMWPFSFLVATVFMLSLYFLSRSLISVRIEKVFFFIGNISIYVFLLNGITRNYFIYFIENYSKNVITYWMYIILHLLITVSLSYLLMKLERYILENIKIKRTHIYST